MTLTSYSLYIDYTDYSKYIKIVGSNMDHGHDVGIRRPAVPIRMIQLNLCPDKMLFWTVHEFWHASLRTIWVMEFQNLKKTNDGVG